MRLSFPRLDAELQQDKNRRIVQIYTNQPFSLAPGFDKLPNFDLSGWDVWLMISGGSTGLTPLFFPVVA